MRIEGELTPEQIAYEICPRLEYNKVNNSSQIINILMEIKYKNKFKEKDEIHKEEIQEIKKRADERIDKELEETKLQRQEFIRRENKIKNSDLLKKSDPKKITIDISPVCTLKKVTDHETRENQNGKVVKVTRLYFEEDVPRRTMDEWADEDGTITELAKQMIGKKIRTTVWKPERHNVMRWWNNIHDVGDTFDDTEN